MKIRRFVSEGPNALAVMEEALLLLRTAPAAAWLPYSAGTAPFILALIFFWADMSRGARAWERCAAEALALTVLYAWMRAGHARFCSHLRAVRGGIKSESAGVRGMLRAAGTAVHPGAWGFLALLPALLAAIPFGWVYAWHQTLCCTAESSAPPGSETAPARAWRLAKLWPLQNHALLSLLAVASFVVFLNLYIAVAVLPSFLKSFFGLHAAFAEYPLWFLNTSVAMAVTALSYAIMDPLIKACYVLRAYYGESLCNGRDILDALAVQRRGRGTAILGMLGLAAALHLGAPAATAAGFNGQAVPVFPATSSPALTNAVSPDALAVSAQSVLARPDFAWRLPRDPEPESHQGWFARTMSHLMKPARQFFRWWKKTLQRFEDWMNSHGRRPPETTGPASSGKAHPYAWLGIPLAVLLAVAAFWVWRLWRRRKQPRGDAGEAGLAPAAAPDLEDESVTAAQLPEEEWIALAARLRAAGDLRKALRAYFLATLATLARLGHITIARFKSNRDYRRELDRATRSRASSLEPFSEDIRLFEQTWYGTHPADNDALDTVERHLEHLRHDSAP